ncbi:hypothetical protein Dimus_036096, partial [Dionaea muscipula]
GLDLLLKNKLEPAENTAPLGSSGWSTEQPKPRRSAPERWRRWAVKTRVMHGRRRNFNKRAELPSPCREHDTSPSGSWMSVLAEEANGSSADGEILKDLRDTRLGWRQSDLENSDPLIGSGSISRASGRRCVAETASLQRRLTMTGCAGDGNGGSMV